MIRTYCKYSLLNGLSNLVSNSVSTKDQKPEKNVQYLRVHLIPKPIKGSFMSELQHLKLLDAR